jgi:hypothetical protein
LACHGCPENRAAALALVSGPLIAWQGLEALGLLARFR